MFARPFLALRCATHIAPVARPFINQFHIPRNPSTRALFIPTAPNMSPTQPEKEQAKSAGSKTEDVEGEHNEWKFRVPYKIHSNDPNFKPLYEGSCHCGRVQYQLSREAPLDAKYCHCSTCQVLHGASFLSTPTSIRLFQKHKLMKRDWQARLFNGQQFSTRKISISRMDITIWGGTKAAKRRQDISCHVKCRVRTVEVRSWMREEI